MNFWLTKHNQAGNETKDEVTKIFEILANHCTETPAKSDDPEEQAELEKYRNRNDNSKSMGDQTANEKSMSLRKSRTVMVTDAEKVYQDRRSKLEEFLIFHIDNCNATPNKEN